MSHMSSGVFTGHWPPLELHQKQWRLLCVPTETRRSLHFERPFSVCSPLTKLCTIVTQTIFPELDIIMNYYSTTSILRCRRSIKLRLHVIRSPSWESSRSTGNPYSLDGSVSAEFPDNAWTFRRLLLSY